MLANFPRGDFARNPGLYPNLVKEKENRRLVFTSSINVTLGNLTWKSCGNVKKCTRKCAPRAVLLSRSLSLFYFFCFSAL